MGRSSPKASFDLEEGFFFLLAFFRQIRQLSDTVSKTGRLEEHCHKTNSNDTSEEMVLFGLSQKKIK